MDKIIKKIDRELDNANCLIGRSTETIKTYGIARGSDLDQLATSSAAVEVFGRVLTYLTSGITIEQVIDEARREMIRMAGQPSQSMSSSSNLIERQKLACWAKVLDIIELNRD